MDGHGTGRDAAAEPGPDGPDGADTPGGPPAPDGTAAVDLTGLAPLIMEQMPVPMAYYDRNCRRVWANTAALRVVDRELWQVSGLRPGELAPGVVIGGGQELEQVMREVMASGESRTYETWLRPGGEHVWTAVLSPVTDGDGRVHGCSVVILDITEQYRARERMAVLDEAGMRIGSTLDVVRTAGELAELATESFADFVAVDLLEPVLAGDEPRPPPPGTDIVFRRTAQASVLDGCPESVVPVGESYALARDSAMGRVLVRGEAVRQDVDEAALVLWEPVDPERVRSMRAHRVHSTLTAPLLARGVSLGIATFGRHRNPDPFDEDDLVLAGELASRAAVAVDNARRYTREHATALALQRSLLPRRTVRRQAVEVASRYLPNTTGAGIGGDWFDVIPLSGARVALVVGDVVGHGVQASATMGRLRTAVRTLADVDLAPDELLTQLDDLVLKLDREEAVDVAGGSSVTGATCLFAVYDPVTGHCSMARAGHPEPVLVRPDGTASLMELPSGPPLGVGGLPFEAAGFELPERSMLALYTDGLVEAPGRDTDAALTVLRDTLARPTGSLDDTCDAVMEALLPARPDDDVALLLARVGRLDADHHASWELPCDPSVVARARKYAAAQLEAWGLSDAVFTTELVVSELVTNAIRYGGSPIRLRLIRDTALVCEVSDGSSTAPHLRRARIYDEGGRGLLLVASLTECWGTRYGSMGKTIWAEQPLPAS